MSFQTFLIFIADSIDVLIKCLMKAVWFSLSFVKYCKNSRPTCRRILLLSKPAGDWHFTFVYDLSNCFDVCMHATWCTPLNYRYLQVVYGKVLISILYGHRKIQKKTECDSSFTFVLLLTTVTHCF